MRRAIVLVNVAALTFSAATAFAQVANFAGHWVAEAPPANGAGGPVTSAADAGGGGGGRGGRAGGGGRGGRGGGAAGVGQEFWATQDAKALTITRVSVNGDTTKTVYNLDGSDSPNAAPVLGGGGRGGANGAPTLPPPVVSTANWDAKTKQLVVSTPITGRGSAPGAVSTTTFWMDGSTLKISTSRPGANGAAPTESLTIYRKQK